MPNPNELRHYGVPGMKWGQRKAKRTFDVTGSNGQTAKVPLPRGSRVVYNTTTGQTTVRSRTRRAHNQVQKRANAAKVKMMSDEELRQKINRIQMEKTYGSITGAQKATGAAAVQKILGNAGKQVASEYAKAAIKAGVEASVKGAINAAAAKKK